MEGLVLVRDGRLGASWFVGRRLPYWHTSRQAGYPVTCGLSLQSQIHVVNKRCETRRCETRTSPRFCNAAAPKL